MSSKTYRTKKVVNEQNPKIAGNFYSIFKRVELSRCLHLSLVQFHPASRSRVSSMHSHRRNPRARTSHVEENVLLQYGRYPNEECLDRVLHSNLECISFRAEIGGEPVEAVATYWIVQMTKRDLNSLTSLKFEYAGYDDDLDGGFTLPGVICRLSLTRTVPISLQYLNFCCITFDENVCVMFGRVLPVFSSLKEIEFERCHLEGHHGRLMLQTAKLSRWFWGLNACKHMEELVLVLKHVDNKMNIGSVRLNRFLAKLVGTKTILRYILAVVEKNSGLNAAKGIAEWVLGRHLLSELSYAFSGF